MDTKSHIEPTYLGDAVYASFDGYHVWLEAGENRIALEDLVVLRALDDYRARIDACYAVRRFAPKR